MGGDFFIAKKSFYTKKIYINMTILYIFINFVLNKKDLIRYKYIIK